MTPLDFIIAWQRAWLDMFWPVATLPDHSNVVHIEFRRVK